MAKRIYTRAIRFDEYDTKKLAEVKDTLCRVYEYNFDHSAKEKKLQTIIGKLEALIDEYGTTAQERGY